MFSANVLWEKAIEIFRRDVTEASYRNFVAGLKPLRIENGNTLILSMDTNSPLSTDFRLSSLNNVYKERIESALFSVSGVQYKIKIVVGEENTQTEGDESHVEPCPTLIPKYTFESFVQGSSNRFAWAGAVAVAESPAKAYNPLYIYSDVGLGKTHLIHAIGNHIHTKHPDYKILYVTSETFTSDVITSIQTNTREQLRSKYRTLDVLIVDDIQFIAGKASTEEEFFNVFNTLRDAGKQIIITSDLPPSAIKNLSDRLKTRFGSGLITDIQTPDYETRFAILRNIIQKNNYDISDDIVQLIAEKITGNVRSLEGCLNGVVAYGGISGKSVTTELARNILRNFVSENGGARIVTTDSICQVVCEYYNVTIDDIVAARRDRRVAFPRQVAMYLMRTLLGISNQQIGDVLGGRHYSTVIHACEEIEKKSASDPALKTIIDDLISRIKSNT